MSTIKSKIARGAVGAFAGVASIYLILAGIGAFSKLDWGMFDVTTWNEFTRGGFAVICLGCAVAGAVIVNMYNSDKDC